MNRRSSRNREKEKPAGQFRVYHHNPADMDKINLRSGTNVQREISSRDRRKVMRDERRARSLSATRLTSSTDPMDTDEAARITRNILIRTGVRPGRKASSDGDETLVGTDLEQTVLEKKSHQEEKRKPDSTKGTQNPEPMKEPFD